MDARAEWRARHLLEMSSCYGLHRGLHWALCGGHVIFLDLGGDRYFGLNQNLEEAFLRFASGELADDALSLQPLVARGPGFTIPANVPGEPSASCSFAVAAGTPLPAQRLGCAELVGAHALAAARRLRPGGPGPQPPHLSRRELDCLRLVALGKTDWEIARILGLSTETVRQYVKRARAAYDAVSRAQLIAFALRDSWISFEEAIPPSGGMEVRG